jgi:hypothetical protein
MRPETVVARLNNLSQLVYTSAVAITGNKLQGSVPPELLQRLQVSYEYLRGAADMLTKSGNRVDARVINGVVGQLDEFSKHAHAILESMPRRQARRKMASATLTNLRKAQRIARQIDRAYEDEDWFLGVRVINGRGGIGLGIGAVSEPPRRLRGSLDGIPLILEGIGARMVQARHEGQKRLRLARRLAAEVAEGLGIDPEEERALKHHQKLVKKVYNHIRNNKRLFGSVKYMSRKMGIAFDDLVRVIGQLIVEGKIQMTKKKKFKPLEPPHTPIPGMDGKFASTNSVFGIDRGRSDKRVDQLLSQSNYQLNMDEHEDDIKHGIDWRDRPSKLMPDPTQPN